MVERVASEYFRGVERLLASQAQVIGSGHASDKGETREELFVGVLNNHLPLTVRAHRGGQILYVSDAKSAQTDVVVYATAAPRLGQPRKSLYLAEGVYAAIEVKSVLTSSALDELVGWSHQIKSTSKVLRRPDGESRESPLSPIVTGLFAYSARPRDPKIIAEKLVKSCAKSKLLPWHVPDFLTINGDITLINGSMMGSVEDLAEPPDFVVQSRSGGVRYIAYRQAFAFLLLLLVGEVQSTREEVLDLMRYLTPRPAKVPRTSRGVRQRR